MGAIKRGSAANGEAIHPQASAVSQIYFWQEGKNHHKHLDKAHPWKCAQIHTQHFPGHDGLLITFNCPTSIEGYRGHQLHELAVEVRPQRSPAGEWNGIYSTRGTEAASQFAQVTASISSQLLFLSAGTPTVQHSTFESRGTNVTSV